MKYLRIHSKNTNVSVTDMFTLGVSTARGTDKIGQFGSGCLMAVLTWLRLFGDSPRFFVNGEKVRFSFSDQPMANGDTFGQVYIHYKKKTPLSVSLEYGIKDWTDSGMALREWISNALDQGETLDCISMVDKIEPTTEGVTVYIPVNMEVLKYWKNIQNYFLQATDTQDVKFIRKGVLSKMRVYRRGVFIREFDELSWADYNLDFDISENRNGSSDSMIEKCYRHAGRYLSKEDAEWLFSKVLNEATSFERNWNCWYAILPSLYGPIIEGNLYVPINAAKMNEDAIPVPEKWYDMIVSINPELDGLAKLSKAGKAGLTILEPSQQAKSNMQKVYDIFDMLGLTNGKALPKLESFTTTNGQMPKALGMYCPRSQTISIWRDQEASLQTMIEEMAHHLSGKEDCTRQFQEFIFRGLTELMQAF